MFEIKKLKNCSKIENMLVSFSNEFNPSLEDREIDFQNYSCKLLREASVWIIKDNASYKGMCVFYINDKLSDVSFLSLISVKKISRNKGYGKKLLEIWEQESKKIGKKYLKLKVQNKNENAQLFYKKNGFKFSEECSEERMIMIKEI